MKAYIIGFLMLICTLTVVSQNNQTKPITQGKVIYQVKHKANVSGDNITDDLMNQLGKEESNQCFLLFNQQANLYSPIEKDSGEEPLVSFTMSTEGITIKKGQNLNIIIYQDLTDNKKIEQKVFLGRDFLIEGPINTVEWKLTGEQKEILGYNCIKAEALADEKKVVVWFTPQIPVPAGPLGYGNLPGLILSVVLNNGTSHIDAVSIDPQASLDAMVPPTEGKKVTLDEFKKIQEEKKKERMNSSAPIIIRK